MENGNLLERPKGSDLFLIVLISFICGFLVFSVFSNPITKEDISSQIPLSVQKDIGIEEVIRMGKHDMDHEDLIHKVRKDLKIPEGLEVKIIVGPYTNIVNEGQLIYSTHPFILLLVINETFYQNLTPEEKIALIAHELGHLTNDVIFLTHSSDISIRFQIEADTYATKYAPPEAMISVLNKANDRYGGFPSRQYYLRIQNLEKIRTQYKDKSISG